jgi:uncharacterized integral membrane protein
MAKEKKVAVKPSSVSPSQPALFMFDKENYVLMVVGIIVVIIGFLLMIGHNNTDPNIFPAEEIYSFRRITLAPIVVMLGFAIEIYAIIKKPKA